MNDSVLSEEELDTLLDGVNSGDVDTADATDSGDLSMFDFNQQHNIIISRLPNLETIIDEFIAAMRIRLAKVYKKDIEVELAVLHTRRFSDYQAQMPRPSNINVVNIDPFNVPGMVLLDARLLYILVDQYFGGTGDLTGRAKQTSFSPIELKMSEQFLDQILREWHTAWEGTTPMQLVVQGREYNPDVLQNFGRNDVVLQAVFQVGFNGNYGEFEVSIPYALLESLRGDVPVSNEERSSRSTRSL